MKKYISIFFAVMAAILLGVYFSGAVRFNHGDKHAGHDHAGHDHGHDHAGESGFGGTHLTPEQMKIAGVKLSKAAAGKINLRLELHGEVKLNADRTAKIMQRVPGFVTDVYVSPGDQVKKGQLMAKLTSHKLGEHYSDYYSSKALEEVAASEYKMAQRLYANKAFELVNLFLVLIFISQFFYSLIDAYQLCCQIIVFEQILF